MNIAFRTDATNRIGTGHFMRCLTLADALRQRGAQIRFVSRGLPVHLRDMLATKGLGFVPLNSDIVEDPLDELAHSKWLGSSQEQDAHDTAQALNDRTWDWLVVDHYALDARWERALRGSTKQIMVIDDLADRQHDCDVLLDQNFYADMQTRYAGKVPTHCHLLMGPRYVLLREEFRKLREQVKLRTGEVKRILVFFGGVDADNYTGRVIEALANIECIDFRVDIVIGVLNPFREQILSNCFRLGFFCHLQTNKMAELMSCADFAIGACGFTSYEFAAMKLPSILIPVTDIQATVARELAKNGLVDTLFFKGKDIVGEISNAINRMISSSSSRTSMSLACRDFLDTYGVNRVINNLFEFEGRK